MNKKLLSLLIAGLFAISVTTSMAIAQPMDDFEPGMGAGQGMGQGMGQQRGGHGKMGKHNNKGHGMMEMFKKLNLTEEQKEQLKAKKESSKTQMKDLREKMMKEKEILMDKMFDPNSTKSELFAQQDKVMAIKNQMGKVRLENISDLKEILTPEQKATLQEIAAEHKAKMKERRNKMKERREQFKQKRDQFKERRQNAPDKNSF